MDEGVRDAVEVDERIAKGLLEQGWIVGEGGELVGQGVEGHAHFIGVADGLEDLVDQAHHPKVPEQPALVSEVEQPGRVAVEHLAGNPHRAGGSIGKGELLLVAAAAGYRIVGRQLDIVEEDPTQGRPGIRNLDLVPEAAEELERRVVQPQVRKAHLGISEGFIRQGGQTRGLLLHEGRIVRAGTSHGHCEEREQKERNPVLESHSPKIGRATPVGGMNDIRRWGDQGGAKPSIFAPCTT